MKYLLVTMLAQVDDDSPMPRIPVDWPLEAYWTAETFSNPNRVDNMVRSAGIAMDRKITQDGMPGC